MALAEMVMESMPSRVAVSAMMQDEEIDVGGLGAVETGRRVAADMDAPLTQLDRWLISLAALCFIKCQVSAVYLS